MYDAGAVVCSRVNAYVQAYRCKSIEQIRKGKVDGREGRHKCYTGMSCVVAGVS